MLELKKDTINVDGESIILPIGTIQAWHKSLMEEVGIELNKNWMECNGKEVTDVNSPLFGKILPNLNGDGRFLRGSYTSGVFQDDDNKSHKHVGSASGGDHNHTIPGDTGWGGSYNFTRSNVNRQQSSKSIGGGSHSHTVTISESGSEARPINMSVVYIMKIK